MKIKNYLIGFSLACLAWGCQDDEQVIDSTPTSEPGAEVQFDAALGETGSRTIYGPEGDTSFPIYWVQDDKVAISSPQCMEGRNSAIYNVSVSSNTQNYATSLDKTGDVGIQWGDNATAHFYSVYPAAKTEVGADGYTMTVTMPHAQYVTIADDNKSSAADMDACFMYAQEFDAPAGETVDLNYKPFSTALRFTVQGPSSGTSNTSVTIRAITINAPVAISGNFTMEFAQNSTTDAPTVTATNNALSSVTIYPTYENNAFLELGVGESVEINAFIFLAQETDIDGK